MRFPKANSQMIRSSISQVHSSIYSISSHKDSPKLTPPLQSLWHSSKFVSNKDNVNCVETNNSVRDEESVGRQVPSQSTSITFRRSSYGSTVTKEILRTFSISQIQLNPISNKEKRIYASSTASPSMSLNGATLIVQSYISAVLPNVIDID